MSVKNYFEQQSLPPELQDLTLKLSNNPKTLASVESLNMSNRDFIKKKKNTHN